VPEFFRRIFSLATPGVAAPEIISDWTFSDGDNYYGFDNLYVMIYDWVHPPTGLKTFADLLRASALSFCAGYGSTGRGNYYVKKLWPGTERVITLDNSNEANIQPYASLAPMARVDLFDAYDAGAIAQSGDPSAADQAVLKLTLMIHPSDLYVGPSKMALFQVLDPEWPGGAQPMNTLIADRFAAWRGVYRPQFQFEISGTDYLPTDSFGLINEAVGGGAAFPVRLSIDYLNRKATGLLQTIDVNG
jgi:hypothetical protein